MSDYQNSDDTKTIEIEETYQLPADVETIIHNAARNIKLENYDFKVKMLDADGGNYLSKRYVVNVKNKKDNSHIMSLFVKEKLVEAELKTFNIDNIFEREIYFYEELSKIIEEMEINANIPKNERFQVVKYYGVTKSGTFVMENMVLNGYTVINRVDVISLEYAKIALKELAKFHSLSFAIQKYKPKYFKTIENLDMLVKKDDHWLEYMKKTVEYDIENNKETNEAKAKVKKFIPRFCEMHFEYLTERKSTCALCHGDYRPNNLMTKTENGEITDIVALDYQFLYYGAFINDFIFFIFSSTDRNFRKNHLGTCKSYYHEQLEIYLKYFNIDVNDVYPKNVFENEFKDKLEFGLMITFMVLPFVLAAEDELPFLAETNEELQVYKRPQIYKDRLNGNIQDFIEWGCL